MRIAVPREILAGEKRVAAIPDAVAKLVARGLDVVVESGAGSASCYSDDEYRAAGARIEASTVAVYSGAGVVLKVQGPGALPGGDGHEADRLDEGCCLISFLHAASQPDLVRRLVDRKVTAFAMELMPRITRAQSMDALSSMSNIAGYKAVLLAACALPRYFPMFMTAAGTITPARVLVLGAGVAGLQAIATARRLGAVVEAFDVRPVVKEQVESLGARFVELPVDTSGAQDAGGYAKEQEKDTQERIRALLHDHVKKSDVVITTALIPGKKAPVLVQRSTIESMRPGSIIVDLAAEQGGNCEGAVAGEDVRIGGVTILGPVHLASSLAVHASQLYARNVTTFLYHLIDKQGVLVIDLEDELTRGPLVTRGGEILHEPTRHAVSASSRG